MSSMPVYRITYSNQDLVYEMYAEQISDEALFGFLKIIKPIFGNQTQVVVDPSEERLKAEFEGVDAFYVPIHNIMRIDEVAQRGQAKIKKLSDGNNVKHFPPMFSKDPSKK